MIQNYLNLIKPGIIAGNLMSSIGGFLIASNGCICYSALIYMSIGLSLIIASSCILNNIIDRDIDSIMGRTKNRILTQKSDLFIKISIFFAVILNIVGFLFLIYNKNLLIILLATIGFFVYVVIYSLWTKRQSIYSMVIGSISGSMPPVIGYCAASNHLDIGAFILLLIFSFWQIPHSYAITIFRLNDYKSALIPTFVIKKGIILTRIHMLICILGFSLATASLTIMKYTSIFFLYIISIINIIWLYTGIYEYYSIKNDLLWAKKMFILSIITIMLLNILLSIDNFLFIKYK